MPLRVTFFLKADGVYPDELRTAEFSRSLLARLMEAASIPEEVLRSDPKPFTFFPFLSSGEGWSLREGQRRPQKRKERITGARPLRLGMSWLLDPDVPAILEWIHSFVAEPLVLELDSQAFLLSGASISPAGGDEWSSWIPYPRLYLDASKSQRTVVLKFCSPTLLERASVPYPLPDPATIFRGYLGQWDTFAALPFCPELQEALEEKLVLVDFRIRRRAFSEGQGELPGFGGSATFRLEGRHPESVLKGLNALADFALFCGTGAGTDRGMGLTRRVLRSDI